MVMEGSVQHRVLLLTDYFVDGMVFKCWQYIGSRRNTEIRCQGCGKCDIWVCLQYPPSEAMATRHSVN